MEGFSDDVVARVVSGTGGRMPAVLAGFVVLIEYSWPDAGILERVRKAQDERTPIAACRALLGALDALNRVFPTATFWWKNELSVFLGFCPRLASASGVPAKDLLGQTDAAQAVAWNRQAALYMRDDRQVLTSRSPRFDILERQDRKEGTVWLRTSKVPYFSEHGDGTLGGFDTISAQQATLLARQRT